MEPSPLGAATITQPTIDISRIVEDLKTLAAEHSLLHFNGTTNFLTLEVLTTDLIRAADRNGEYASELTFCILYLWFPSILVGVEESGTSSNRRMSHFFDLALKVQSILFENGYVDMPDLMEEPRY
jgi:hypothetical protein